MWLAILALHCACRASLIRATHARAIRRRRYICLRIAPFASLVGLRLYGRRLLGRYAVGGDMLAGLPPRCHQPPSLVRAAATRAAQKSAYAPLRRPASRCAHFPWRLLLPVA